jgi:amino acid transporter
MIRGRAVLSGKPGLKRELGLLHATMMGIGGAIEAGVFVMLGYATGLAGSSIVVALIVCGVINLFTMLSYAELGSAIPKAGGEYTFAKAAYGGFVSFLTGWFEWISNMFYAALSAVGFGYIISYLIPVNVPITALITIAVFTVINVRGVEEVGKTQTLMVGCLLAVLAAFTVNGLAMPSAQQFQLNAPAGPLGVIQATAYIFVVYLGAEAIAVAQAEVKNPAKTIPRAILLTAAVLLVLYPAIAYAMFRIVPPEAIVGQSSPLIYAAQLSLGDIGKIALVLAGTVAALSSINTSIMAQSRVAYALSRDGYFPKTLQRIHHKFCTPHIAVLVGAILTAVFAATGVTNFVGYATDFGFIVGFALVNLSLIKLRKEKPLLDRPFKTPLYPFTPIAGIATSLFLLAFIDLGVLALGAVLSIFAVLAYYIRMVGRLRIRIAFGGISLGLGGFAALLAYLISTGVVQLSGVSSTATTLIMVVLLFASVIQVIAGILNVTART